MLFINPNIGDIRKFLIALISRLSAIENDTKGEDLQYTYEERIQNEKNKNFSNALKKWKTLDWILPELLILERSKYKVIDITFKNYGEGNLMRSLKAHDPNLKKHFYSSIISEIHKYDALNTKNGYDYKSKGAEKMAAEKTKKILNYNQESWVGAKRYMPKSILKPIELSINFNNHF